MKCVFVPAYDKMMHGIGLPTIDIFSQRLDYILLAITGDHLDVLIPCVAECETTA